MNFSRIELPITTSAEPSPGHIFTQDELRTCKEGTCCQCGRCCFFYRVIVPKNPLYPTYNREFHNHNNPVFEEKMPNTVCHNLQLDAHGRAACLCHSMKEAPLLADCNAFNGKEGNYEHVVASTRELFVRPRTIEEIQLLQNWLVRGLLSDLGDPFPGR